MVSYGDEEAAAYAVAEIMDHSAHDAVNFASETMGADTMPPGSEILTYRQIEERPHRDFLMHQQGFLSGKTSGDLDSVPGYYAGTASYRFVQNAKHLNQLRVTKFKMNYTLGEHYDEYGRVMSDSPAARLRGEVLAEAKKIPFEPYTSIGPDMAFKEADQYGAFLATQRPFQAPRYPYDRARMGGYPGYPGGVYGVGEDMSPGMAGYPRSGYPRSGYGFGSAFPYNSPFANPSRLPSTLQSRLNPAISRELGGFNELNRPQRAGEMSGRVF